MGGKQETKEKVKWATNEGRGLAAGQRADRGLRGVITSHRRGPGLRS